MRLLLSTDAWPRHKEALCTESQPGDAAEAVQEPLHEGLEGLHTAVLWQMYGHCLLQSAWVQEPLQLELYWVN